MQGIIKWIEDNRLSWDHISDQEKYPGWEDVFDESLKIDRVDPFDHKNPQWQATANKEITITQTVNNGSQQSTQQIKVNYDVVIYIAIDPNMSGWDALFGNYKFIISDVKVSNINKVDPDTNTPKDDFDAVNIPTAPEGFENRVTGTIEGPKFDDYNINNNISLEDKVIKTNLDSIFNTILQKGTDVTFKYDIEQIAVKKPTWVDVIDGDDKKEWNDLFQNVDFTKDQDKDNIWTGTVTLNKDIIQTINGLDQENKQTIHLTKDVTITIQRDGNTNNFKILTVNQSNWTPNDSLESTDISKPGYNHNVSASITGTSSDNFTHKVENGHLSTNLDFSKLENNNNQITINYKVSYSPNFGDIALPPNMDLDDLKPDKDNENIFTGTITTDKVINQTVNGKPANDITFSQTVSVTVTWDKENAQWVVSEPKVEINGYTPIDINKPGYSIDKVEADIIGESDFKVEDGKLVVNDKALANLQNGQTINYTVTYSPVFGDIILPPGIDKDDLVENPDGSWTANTTINKVITQNIANANGNINQITLSQAATVTLTLKDGKWTVDIKGFGDVTVKDDNPINVNRPGYKHDVSASIDGTKFDGLKIDDDGNIVINASAWDILKDGDTISYIVNYTPIKPQPDTVTPPNKDDDNIWSDDVTDKEKDDIIDKIEDGALTWTDNGDGTWSATVDFNKQLSQSISGNMINGLPNITVDVTKKVTLTAELKGDKFHITSVTSGKWTSDSNLGQKLPESDNKYDISATVNGNDHAGLKAEVENTNTIPGLDSDLIQSIINNHEYGSLLQLSYVINANPGSADPDKPAEPDTPNVDPDMGVDPENPSNPDDNNGSGDSNNSGNNPGSSDSTENTTPKPEEGPEVKPVTTPTEFTPPLSEDIEDDDKKANPDSDSAQSESNKDNKGKTVTGSKATGKKATIISLSESITASQNSSANSQNSLATTDNEIALPQTGENKDNLSMMGIIMAGLAGALTTLGTAIKKKKKN
ncbi:LPXTG cell wall anchor domain-containing protein [Lactobacillus acidophilus]|uniref:LPXTG cell wall anchor domain-containing protein n=1 Tax=Lactobacillus acidophilus TaxID=1579 RepID=UPI000354F2BA|nr:LPXTG cell wall anchor domain-containing protein [Lactobacillus acidophilus]MBN3484116.1 LPXTG cell wall anchor domain-containing protein [Lactobacillus acidophilus]MCT3627058.1 LPXTG cell wall anchor domain-containing protein [Lactobacillus acidophilus]UEX75790.1 LPXTG cell wall anchor domain-containing protein [Lactobacillus acidophilus]UIP48309.1 LPXTG cell wall anchor domain-containing protein [Lactobacillus acidophilus]UTX30488.1 LPXTG cell wall anchor domain-containing protein [Lactob